MDYADWREGYWFPHSKQHLFLLISRMHLFAAAQGGLGELQAAG
jgi:hypothetical protein